MRSRPGVRRDGFDKGDAAVTATKDRVARAKRNGALPEDTVYLDDGCDIHPHCLTCPLPVCRYDVPGGWGKLVCRDPVAYQLRLVEGNGR